MDLEDIEVLPSQDQDSIINELEKQYMDSTTIQWRVFTILVMITSLLTIIRRRIMVTTVLWTLVYEHHHPSRLLLILVTILSIIILRSKEMVDAVGFAMVVIDLGLKYNDSPSSSSLKQMRGLRY